MLTYTQAAKELTCSVRTLQRIIQDGQLHPVRIRGLKRIREGDITNLIRKCELVAYKPKK